MTYTGHTVVQPVSASRISLGKDQWTKIGARWRTTSTAIRFPGKTCCSLNPIVPTAPHRTTGSSSIAAQPSPAFFSNDGGGQPRACGRLTSPQEEEPHIEGAQEQRPDHHRKSDHKELSVADGIPGFPGEIRNHHIGAGTDQRAVAAQAGAKRQ